MKATVIIMKNNTLIKHCPGKSCFACLNSGEGFRIHFEEILEGISYLYVIKGGPGTGKSRLLSRIAEKAEKEGEEVLRIFCSSDPDSLDGVLLKTRRIALVDGTAPHEASPGIPGVNGEYFDLGACWNNKLLESSRSEIETLNKKKKEAYNRVFLLLKAAKKVFDCKKSLIFPYVNSRFTERFVKKCLCKSGCRADTLPSRIRMFPQASIGMKGAVTLDTLIEEAEEILTVTPFHGTEFLLLEELRKSAEHSSSPLLLSPDPISLLPDSLYFSEKHLLVRCGESLDLTNEKTISSKSALNIPDISLRKTVRALDKESENLLTLARNELSKLSEEHFALEKIYGAAMDFDKVNRMAEELEKRIF